MSGSAGNHDASLPFVLCSLLQREFSGRRRSPYRHGRKDQDDEEQAIG